MSIVKDIDKGWIRIKKEMAAMKGSHVEVGVLSSAGAYAEDGVVNLASVATFNEFGTSRIPPRPFMKQSFDSNIENLKNFIEVEKSNIFSGESTTSSGLRKLGVFFTGKIKEEIAKGGFTANAPSTIALKGSSKPLIDTGRLRNSINFEVKLK